MIPLQTALDDYLALHRALGFELRLAGRLLQRFVDFAQAAGAAYITTELALQWASQPAHAQPAQWANRLGMVRRFAHHARAEEPAHESDGARVTRRRRARSPASAASRPG